MLIHLDLILPLQVRKIVLLESYSCLSNYTGQFIICKETLAWYCAERNLGDLQTKILDSQYRYWRGGRVVEGAVLEKR